jgi:hypothetical protein
MISSNCRGPTSQLTSWIAAEIEAPPERDDGESGRRHPSDREHADTGAKGEAEREVTRRQALAQQPEDRIDDPAADDGEHGASAWTTQQDGGHRLVLGEARRAG